MSNPQGLLDRCPSKEKTYFDASHAAETKHSVIAIDKTIGGINRYIQLTTVNAAKQSANAHAMPRMRAKISFGRPPSSQASIAEKNKNTPTENPAPRKKSQNVRLNPCTPK